MTQTSKLILQPLYPILVPSAHKIMGKVFYSTIQSKNGKNGGNVFNIKRELFLSYVLAIISTKRLTVGLFKKRWMYCHTQFAGGNSTLVFGGGQPRYKVNENKNPRNAPGSRLSRCRAILNVRLLKLEHGEILHVTFPLSSAHSGHALKSLADMHAYQPLPEVIERVESLVTNSYLSQVSLKLSLKEWVMKGIIDDIPSEFDKHYHPTAQDLRNMTKGFINKIRKNTFDQDALKILLQNEAKQHPGFQYFLRKYKKCDAREWYVY